MCISPRFSLRTAGHRKDPHRALAYRSIRWLHHADRDAGHYALLAETIGIARALQPALIVLEDVDLVGGHRDGPWAGGGSTLNLLRNETDGLAPEARMLFVLTTNRP